MKPKPDQQSIAWLREQAMRYRKMAEEARQNELRYTQTADEMQQFLELSVPDAPRCPPPQPPQPQPGIVMNGASHREAPILTVEAVRDYLKHKGGRPIHVAEHFGVSPEEVKRIVNMPNSGVHVAERGWLKLSLF